MSEEGTFNSVVSAFLNRLSELTSTAEPFDYHVDTLWGLLDPYIMDSDQSTWEIETIPMDYSASMKKLRIISLVLYRTGVLPRRDIRNRKFHAEIQGVEIQIKQGMTGHIKEDLRFSEFLTRHQRLLAFLTKKGLDITIHIDVLWFLLSPYVTEEDYYKWEMNNETFGNPKSRNYSPYIWNIEKLKIIAGVMNRADFMWKTTVIDAPEEYVDREGNIRVRSSVTRRG